MPAAVSCPDRATLQQLSLGKLSAEEINRLAAHCEGCASCIQVLRELNASDTVVEAMASLSTSVSHLPLPTKDSFPPELARLMEKMARLPSGLAGEGTVALSGGGAPAAAPGSEDTFAGLEPAQGPDEMGRLGGYRVLKLLGAGGMGMVYQAEDVQLQRMVALKVMKSDLARNATARERFLREARAAARLKSDHVVNIYQVGEVNQAVFLAMEYLEGLSLDDWLKKDRVPTLPQAVRIGQQIALGLADAHAAGLIHRDIKPANVWLESRHQGRVKLLDFGLARSGAGDDHQLTQSGAILGTPAYMAPEQARGEKVDHRADLFSLGVVLYRLTTGQLPFRGDNTMSVLTALALDTPTPAHAVNPAIPPRLAELIERLLAKERDRRPATAREVATELAAIERAVKQPEEEHTEQTVALPAAPVAQAERQRPRRRWLVAAALLLVLGGVAAAVVVIIRDKQGKKVAEITVPEGGSVETRPEGTGTETAKKPPIAATPLPALKAGEPLSPIALVQRPAKLPGVRSWSIESRGLWYPWSVVYRPDGKRLAVAGVDGLVRIWDPESGRLVQLLVGPGPIYGLAWSPDGRMVASTCWTQQMVHLWDAETGRLVRILEAPTQAGPATLAWSSDGQRLLLHHVPTSSCFAWSAADGKLLRTRAIPCHYSTFSPDGKRLAGVRADGHVAVWDAETGKEVRSLDAPASTLSTLVWSPD